MQTFQLHVLENLAAEEKRPYFEFLRVPAMSVGLYRLTMGQPDPQSPHKQDEVYYVLSGKAKPAVDGKQIPALPGTILFVEAGMVHQFVEIEENLEVLVFFAPAEQT